MKVNNMSEVPAALAKSAPKVSVGLQVSVNGTKADYNSLKAIGNTLDKMSVEKDKGQLEKLQTQLKKQLQVVSPAGGKAIIEGKEFILEIDIEGVIDEVVNKMDPSGTKEYTYKEIISDAIKFGFKPTIIGNLISAMCEPKPGETDEQKLSRIAMGLALIEEHTPGSMRDEVRAQVKENTNGFQDSKFQPTNTGKASEWNSKLAAYFSGEAGRKVNWSIVGDRVLDGLSSVFDTVGGVIAGAINTGIDALSGSGDSSPSKGGSSSSGSSNSNADWKKNVSTFHRERNVP